MRAFFNFLTTLSLRFRFVTLALAIAIILLGVMSATQLKQELLPPIQFPSTVILAQVSGMTSQQVLDIITLRLEDELSAIDELTDIQSTTTGAFGAVLQLSSEFGRDQARLLGRVQQAIDAVWLPERRIQPAAGEDAQAFADRLLADLTADVLIYLAEQDSNFLFQLSPAVWESLNDETVIAAASYLASLEESDSAETSALRQLVDKEIVPLLQTVPQVGTVSVDGGQVLPGDESALALAAPGEATAPQSLLLKVSDDIWQVIAARAGLDAQRDENTPAAFADIPFTIPAAPPSLPESWQTDHFTDASDLLEMQSTARSIADAVNNLRKAGFIAGALGQTNDLTPETIQRMLEIDPSMVEYFTAEHLAAMSEDVFAALPDDFIAGLDGFTRDALAAASMAESITGVTAAPQPVALPAAWRIPPPQIISFSFDDLPLVTFSVFGTPASGQETAAAAAEDSPTAAAPNETEAPSQDADAPRDVPEGPPLPFFFSLVGSQFGVELNTADDLINITLPENLAAQLGADTLAAADFLNFLVLLNDPENLPAGVELPTQDFDLAGLIRALPADAVAFVAANDPGFVPALNAEVYNLFSDTVLALPQLAPPLAAVWDTLAGQPQFANSPLRTARDLLELGGGSASALLNTINQTVPERFSGYEVRLLDSLTPGVVRYFVLNEPDFFAKTDADTLRKLSPAVLALIPDDVLAQLDAPLAAELRAIASGEQPSAATALADRYTTELPPGDPAAPALNSQWSLLEPFYNIELNTADDFFRFPADFPFANAAGLMNSIFSSAQGAAFAPNLFGNLTVEAVSYMLQRDPQVFDDLTSDALRLFTPETFALLPAALQERTLSSAEPFTPTTQITRTDRAASLLLTVYKASDANTVETFHIVNGMMQEIDAANPAIEIKIAVETASFVEDSINGVAREGMLGGIFAILVILVFLSDGVWQRNRRRLAGTLITLVFAAALALALFSGLEAAGGSFERAFQQIDAVVRILLIIGIAIGLAVRFWPGSLPDPSWRSTLVVAVSIPLSLLAALAIMNWIPPFANELLAPLAETSALFAFIRRLFPASVTLNIMTLSGLTVAIGRVVDDSIVVLENIFRELQAGSDKRTAILTGTRDVSIAIFSATLVTVVVFLPLGLSGGLISEFFLPFGLAVTYALMASFIVAITVVPALAYIFIRREDIVGDDAGPIASSIARYYLPVLRWSLSTPRTRIIVIGIAVLSMVMSGALFASRPFAFLPEFGEPEIAVNVNMPLGTSIIETDALVRQMEDHIAEAIPADELGTIRTTVGGGGFSLDTLLGTNSVNQNQAQISVLLNNPDRLDRHKLELRGKAEEIFGPDNVTVSAASLAEAGGFGGFGLVVSGPQDVLAELDPLIITTLNDVPGLANATSTLSQIAAQGGGDGPATYLRINRESAVSYDAELETEDTLGVTQRAIDAVLALDLPDTVTVSQGAESALQFEGFVGVIGAMGIAMVFVIIILIFTFASPIHWITIIFSVIVAPVGAAIALTITNEVLGVSALIGLLMLIGLVVTNAVVLIDRVQSSRRERSMSVDAALLDAGDRRLRPILMTTLATIIALIPLAVGLSDGALIAAQLGIVVIGGITSSMILTLIVVPVIYRVLDPLNRRITDIFRRGPAPEV